MKDVVDDFIGQKFGKDGHLTVIELYSKGVKGTPPKYKVHCAECAKDTELFGNGVFISSRMSLIYGHLPCGCALTPRWTEYQWDVRIRRQCSKMGYDYLGYVYGNKGSRGKLKLRCNTDGNYWETTTADQILKGVRCKVCVAKKKSEEATISDEKMTEMILTSSERFSGVEKFWRSGRRNARGDLSYWAYKCPICSEDEYVKAGLCNGVFEGFSGTLLRGQTACRCSPSYSWTKEQREYQINKILNTDTKYKFVGWDGEFVKSNSLGLFRCTEHGEFKINLTHFIHGAARCPNCSRSGYKKNLKGYLYVLYVEGAVGNFTGYGITNIPKDRLSAHKTNLAKNSQSITNYCMFEGDGEFIYNLEQEIKDHFALVPQITQGFKTEATYSYCYSDVIKFVEGRLLEIDNSQNKLNFPCIPESI